MTIKPGLFAGLNTGLKTSSLTKFGSVALGPALLADFDYRTPQTVGIGGNGTWASANATDEWLISDIAYSAGYANNVGSETLDDDGDGGLIDQDCPGVWDGTDYVANAWETTAVTHQLNASGTTAGDFDATSENFAFRIVFRVKDPGVWPGSEHLISKYDTAGWRCYTSAARWLFALTDSSANTVSVTGAAPTSGSYQDGAVHMIEGWVDNAGNTMYTKGDISAETSSSIAAIVATTASAAGIALSGHIAGSGLAGWQVLYAGVCVGANAQAFYDETVVMPGADVSGLLTTSSRDSTISVPVSATQVAHFSAGTTVAGTQLPIGYHTNLVAGAGGYGLYCNSAITNLVTESEKLASWTSSSMTETDDFGDAPDGFRGATKLAATGANGYSANTIVTVAATEYTLSVWIKEITVGCTGRLIFYDETGAAELASQVFTATSEWVPVLVTATTNAGQVSSSIRVEIDTNTEECYAWGAQANLGSSQGAYIRTSGSSAALVFSNYQRVDAGGESMKGHAGEVEIVHVAGFPYRLGSTPYLFSAGANQANRRSAYYTNGTTLGLYMTDGAATAVATITISGITPSAQENTETVRFDGDGTLAIGGGADAEILHNGASSTTDIGTYIGTDTSTVTAVGNYHYTPANAQAWDGFISRIRIWDGER